MIDILRLLYFQLVRDMWRYVGGSFWCLLVKLLVICIMCYKYKLYPGVCEGILSSETRKNPRENEGYN